MPNRIEAGEAKTSSNRHREAKAAAPVLDSTPYYTRNQKVTSVNACSRHSVGTVVPYFW